MKRKVIRKAVRRTEVDKPKSINKPANLTQEEAAIFERINAEGKTTREWEGVTEEDVLDFTLAQDPMKLPDFAEKMRDARKNAFRWVERKKERLDEIRSMPKPRKWWIVNATTMPESENDLDPILGCVCKYDQLLVFKPYWMYVKEKQMETAQDEKKASAGELASKHHAQVDDTGSEFLAGKEYKIGGKDEVQFHETDPAKVADSETAVIGQATAFEAGDDEVVEDIVAED
jgi:hypothetical protein